MAVWVSRSSCQEHSPSAVQCPDHRKRRTFELGRLSANIKLGTKRIHIVRTRGGNTQYRALRLNHGNPAWASENETIKARLIGVVRTPLVLLHSCDGLLTVYCALYFRSTVRRTTNSSGQTPS